MNNKKGVSTFVVLGFMVLGLLAIYLILHLPIPSFSPIKSLMDYVMIILFWIVLQIGLVYGYYQLGRLVGKGFYTYKKKVHLWNVKVKNFLLTHS